MKGKKLNVTQGARARRTQRRGTKCQGASMLSAKAQCMVDRPKEADASGKCRRAQTYKRRWQAMEGIHSHIAVQLSLIHTKSHGSKSGKINLVVVDQ